VTLVKGNWSVRFGYDLFAGAPGTNLTGMYGQSYVTLSGGLPGGPPSTLTPTTADQGQAKGSFLLPGPALRAGAGQGPSPTGAARQTPGLPAFETATLLLVVGGGAAATRRP